MNTFGVRTTILRERIKVSEGCKNIEIISTNSKLEKQYRNTYNRFLTPINNHILLEYSEKFFRASSFENILKLELYSSSFQTLVVRLTQNNFKEVSAQ